MKGAVPLLRRADLYSPEQPEQSIIHHNVVQSAETEKRKAAMWADHSSI
jgi:hypothetical protein